MAKNPVPGEVVQKLAVSVTNYLLNLSLLRHTIPGMGIFQERIGAGIRLLRKRRGLSQSAIARLRGKDDQSRMSKVERGQQLPTMDLLDSYIETMDADPYELADAMFGEDPDPDLMAEHMLRAARLGDLAPLEREFALTHLKSHREFLVKALRQNPSKTVSSSSDS